MIRRITVILAATLAVAGSLQMRAAIPRPGSQWIKAHTPRRLFDDESAHWHRVCVASAAGSVDQRHLLDAFLSRWPASPHRVEARLLLAGIDFDAADYAAALRGYNAIDPAQLSPEHTDDYTFRRAYCLMKLGEYSQAATGFESLLGSEIYGSDATLYLGYTAYVRKDYQQARRILSRCNGNPAAEAYLMELDFEQRDFATALSRARKVAGSDTAAPDAKAEALRVAGESLYGMGRSDEATAYLKRYVEAVESPRPSALYILGVSAYAEGDMGHALGYFQGVVADGRELSQSAYLYMGQAYARQGEANNALMAFEKAYRQNIDRRVQESAFYNYAAALTEGGRTPFGSSAAVMDDFITEFPRSAHSPRIQAYLVTGYMADNDYDSALRAINRLPNPDRNVMEARQRVMFVIGTREYTAGHITQASSMLREVIAMGRGYNDDILRQSRLWLADCCYSQGSYADAASEYRAWLRDPQQGASDTYNRSVANYGLGYALLAQHSYRDALKAFTDAAAEDRSASMSNLYLADCNNRAADCQYYLNRFADASASYDRAYALSPETGDYALYQKAVVTGLQGNYAAKVSMIDRMLGEFPSSPLVASALLEKAESQVAIGQSRQAISTYTTLTEGYASSAPGRNGHLQMAITYLSLGERQIAIDTYREVVRRYPTSEEARLASEDLKRLYAEDGNLWELSDFLTGIDNAPRLDPEEIDITAFDAAENAYINSGQIRLLTNYIEQYPNGERRARALYYLAESTANAGDLRQSVKYATEAVENYPHAETTENALLLKGDGEMALGKIESALASYEKLSVTGSTPAMQQQGRLGALRAASKLNRHQRVVEISEVILASSAAPDHRAEVEFMRANALDAVNRHSEAEMLYSQLASDSESIYGSMSAVALGQSLLDRGQLDRAEKVIDAFINANPPYAYWLARGFILYSDILRAKGDTFEADEYLRSLSDNYPGKEADIREMIKARLK